MPEDNLLVLIEDEELPQKQRNIRPRLPPTGKITAIKKKIVANSFFLSDDEDEENGAKTEDIKLDDLAIDKTDSLGMSSPALALEA